MKFQDIRDKETIFKQFQKIYIIYFKDLGDRIASDFSRVTLDTSSQQNAEGKNGSLY